MLSDTNSNNQSLWVQKRTFLIDLMAIFQISELSQILFPPPLYCSLSILHQLQWFCVRYWISDLSKVLAGSLFCWLSLDNFAKVNRKALCNQLLSENYESWRSLAQPGLLSGFQSQRAPRFGRRWQWQGAHRLRVVHFLALKHSGRPSVLKITSRDSNIEGGRTPAALTRTPVQLNLLLCLLLLLLLLLITAGEVFNECRSGPPVLAYSMQSLWLDALQNGAVRDSRRGQLDSHDLDWSPIRFTNLTRQNH